MRTITDGLGKALSLAIRLTAALGALAILALALLGTADVLSTRILIQSILDLITIVLLLIFPVIATWLPEHMM